MRRLSVTARAEAVETRPPLLLSAEDHDRLVALAAVMRIRNPLVARLLTEETDRAEVVPAGQVPPDVVEVGSLVEFRDTASGETREVRVVLPHETDIDAGRISILSLIGAGLIGVAQGRSIDWPTQDGRLRSLVLLRVEPPARAGG
ncbi:nucleoside diphosphate kinase regulator [Falsiroseomonas sp. CW058]|uniref:nucleoside diphosphate kinase regulator n=1 Tax=Falsiroseomonas sp. CW058 TaxID=3388664 RepID=UPI003D318406